MNNNLPDYYHQRAQEYERIYYKPERQTDLEHLKQSLPNHLSGLNVLEIGCGTGFWTQFLAEQAQSILATDINHSVMEIAQSKFQSPSNVSFIKSDMYELTEVNDVFEGVFAGFVWSHIPVEKLTGFLQHIHRFVAPGGKIVFTDNQYAEGSSTPIFITDEQGNTYQKRFLEDGSTHMVLKNFPEDKFLKNVLSGLGEDIQIERLTYFWTLSYRVVGVK
ncbi:MAG: methyltransferase domain-containing protein [Bacteroidetes bacterium]|nr:methyltransferase domain-containing protein [Bacteroidota bacterium]